MMWLLLSIVSLYAVLKSCVASGPGTNMFRPSATNKGIRGKMAPYDVSHQLEGAVGSMKTNERSRKVSLKMSAIDYEVSC